LLEPATRDVVLVSVPVHAWVEVQTSSFKGDWVVKASIFKVLVVWARTGPSSLPAVVLTIVVVVIVVMVVVVMLLLGTKVVVVVIVAVIVMVVVKVVSLVTGVVDIVVVGVRVAEVFVDVGIAVVVIAGIGVVATNVDGPSVVEAANVVAFVVICVRVVPGKVVTVISEVARLAVVVHVVVSVVSLIRLVETEIPEPLIAVVETSMGSAVEEAAGASVVV